MNEINAYDVLSVVMLFGAIALGAAIIAALVEWAVDASTKRRHLRRQSREIEESLRRAEENLIKSLRGHK